MCLSTNVVVGLTTKMNNIIRMMISTTSRISVLKFVLKFVRLLYIGGAMYFLCFGYYTTIMMAKERYRNVKEEVEVLPKYRYPSLTFCYGFKDSGNHYSGKYVWKLYYRNLMKKWKQSGNYHAIYI